jgi:uncharacterized membrane protein
MRERVWQAAYRPWLEVSGRDFQFVLVASTLLLALLIAGDQAPFLALPRAIAALLFVLFVPGYCLGTLLFSGEGDLGLLERLSLSIGLSIALVPLIALLLDWLPWGIHLWSIVLVEYGLTVVSIGLSLWRRSRLEVQPAFIPEMVWRPRTWWRSLSTADKRIGALLAGAMLLASVSVVWILIPTSPKEQLTEFYILGQEKTAEDYPRVAAVGDTLTTSIGIIDREMEDRTYRIEVWFVDPWNSDRRTLVGQVTDIQLSNGESRESSVSWRVPWAGDDQQVQFLLFAEGNSAPYRQLRLWLNTSGQTSSQGSIGYAGVRVQVLPVTA